MREQKRWKEKEEGEREGGKRFGQGGEGKYIEYSNE